MVKDITKKGEMNYKYHKTESSEVFDATSKPPNQSETILIQFINNNFHFQSWIIVCQFSKVSI